MQREINSGAVYVYEAPVRIWHWVNALSITLLAITGYLVASPLPSMSGEASDHFLMGYIRFVHFAAAYIFAVGFLGRIYWALVGNEHARQLFKLPVHRLKFWRELLHEVRWYAFLEKEPKKYVGHNPLAHLFMVVIITVGGFCMLLTGFALYAEQVGQGSWQDTLFGWLIPLVGQSQDVRLWHHWGMWVIVVFVMLHVYVAIREDIVSRQSIISTMVSGWRTFKDDRP
ncbi:MAG: Ni/Fe-hydrogenase, b-type cytochrome subunit [Sedimenticola sp.]|uniref:Ni/Fe-hydrogenase, b-type cytochrome subunit n=1 Tax=Sedimenticola thiotaurini TaxID=1543721 RepID=A0A558CV38_9GAMM|nr:Ni/Fe-hydrogenase, b-type cytochrome subunit [Sedimenticola sp.]MCW8950257.1 Ni/Fe-hydrogenase, b-type cytochrome subunit [Sedimenticola sp.]MCW8976626.1 Ni/Fe-hydrogenase, b-type cytochrome subunit [Sedimenticola sp.]TVT52639.1 MAG: Ni/Fe-hydrogenase, b-type cytochrome subunit [Sedimenticola thiotaurini]